MVPGDMHRNRTAADRRGTAVPAEPEATHTAADNIRILRRAHRSAEDMGTADSRLSDTGQTADSDRPVRSAVCLRGNHTDPGRGLNLSSCPIARIG